MRSASAIKMELIRLRFTVRLPLKKISDDARCNPQQIMDAMRLEASETVQRRLDAYLDAKKLHVHDRESKLLSDIERLSREMAKFLEVRNIPMRDVYIMPVERQKRLYIAMGWRAKRLLREKIEKETGKTAIFPDGKTYWRCKASFYAWDGKLLDYRKPDHRKGKGAVVQRRHV